MDDTFEKQRRNLLITSMILLLIQFAGVTISNDIKTSLISLKIANPEIIVYFLYAIHLYLLTRFIYNRPVESHGIFILYYHYRMIYLAGRVLDTVKKCIVSHREHEEDMARMHSNQQDAGFDEYIESISPELENQTSEILNKKREKQTLLEKTASEIECYGDNNYRWQYQEGRYDEVTSFVHDFNRKDVLLSYTVALFTTLFSEHFSRYQLPLLVSVPPVFLFICYMYQIAI